MILSELVSWLSVLLTAALAAMVLVRRPPAPLWPSLFFVGALGFVLTLGAVVANYVADSELAYSRWLAVHYTGLLWLPATWWFFGLRFAEMHGVRLPPKWAVLQWGPLALSGAFWIAMLTHGWHGAFITPHLDARNDFHAIWYAQTVVNYVLLVALCGLFLWLRARSTDRLVREQLAIMTVASITPVLFNFSWISGLLGDGVGDLTSAGLGVSMALFFTGIYRDRLFALSSISMHHLIEHEQDGMLVMDRANRLLHSNPAAERLFDGSVLAPNLEVFELLAQHLRAEPGGDRVSARDLEREIGGRARSASGTLYRLTADPARRVELHVIPIPDRSGRWLGTGLRLRDVSALFQAREQVREQATVLEAILGSAEQGMLVVDSKGETIYSNRAFLDLWSTTEGEGLEPVLEQTSDADAFRAELTSLGEASSDSSRREMLLHDGRVIERASRPLVLDDAVVGRVFSFFDVTAERVAERERHQLERQMLQAQKMESLGILAGGIAHDFNNLLVGILGNADLALASVPSDSSLHGLVSDILESSRRAAELTNQMLAYSGRSRFVLSPIDLAHLADETRQLLHAVISKKASIELDLQPVPLVEGDSAQIRQVIMNLITNASDALKGEGGTIRVATRELEIGRDVLGRYQLGDTIEPGRYVCLEVSDTGAGMDVETAGRIFDPFFTTKFTGRGLGLSAVLGIARAHQGAIDVDSAPGRGTTIRFVLPPAPQALARPSALASAIEGDASVLGTGTVLIADDEPPVLRVLTRTLERAGYAVVPAAHGREALERWAERQGDFVAVILDMTMPEQGGRETLRALREAGAVVPIILSSGYSAEEASAQLGAEQPDAFIQKPFSSSDLVSTLRRAIDERR